MNLLPDFCKIKSVITEDSVVKYSLWLNPGHPIFKAHFPGHPITPGVCIVRMATELLSVHLGRKLELTLIKNVKFLVVIAPDDGGKDITFGFKKIEAQPDGTCRVQADVCDLEGGMVYCKMSLVLK